MAITEEVRRSVQLPRSDVEWFEESYGEGKLAWVMGLLLCEFRKAHSLHPNDYAHIAAKELKSKIEDSLT